MTAVPPTFTIFLKLNSSPNANRRKITYQSQDTWKENLVFEKESFELLQDILESAGELEKRADYEKLVTTIYAKEAMKK